MQPSRSLLSVLASLVLAGCGDKPVAQTSQPTPPGATEGKPEGAFQVALGDATVVALSPEEVPLLKLGADGKVQLHVPVKGGAGNWIAGPVVAKDGTVARDAESTYGRITKDAFVPTEPPEDGTKFTIAADRVVIDIPGLEPATFDLQPDGTVVLGGRPDKQLRWRIDAADRAVARTALVLLATSMKARLD